MRTNKIFFTLLCLTVMYVSFPACAEMDERTAGGSSFRAARAVPVPPDPHGPEAAASAIEAPEEETVGVQEVNYTVLESYGTLSKPSQGGLGPDLWSGSKRSLILDRLEQMPGATPYRIFQDMGRRLLLTGADVSLMRRDHPPESGRDLTTLRLEKLLDMGSYRDALKLYTHYPDGPYHERYARYGVLAALYSRQPTIACLETNAIGDRFQNVVFWQQMEKICDYILSKDTHENVESRRSRPNFPESTILQRIVDKDSFMYAPRKMAELKDLEPLEAAVLTALGRFDLGALEIPEDAWMDMPPHVLTLFAEDSTISEETRFSLYLATIKRGLRPPSELAPFYVERAREHFGKNTQNTSLADYRKIQGWKRLPYLNRAAGNAELGAERATIVREALNLAPTYGSAALYPFTSMIAETDPNLLSAEVIRKGFSVLLETGADIPDAWAQHRFGKNDAKIALNEAELLQYIAYRVHNPSGPKTHEPVEIKESLSTIEPRAAKLLLAMEEKLDKSHELHNYADGIVYDNAEDLTSSEDYVMQSMGLIESLREATTDKRLGEVILLSSILLHGAPPHTIEAGLLREVIDDLLAVGLIEEARSLSVEVILGLSEKI